MTILLDNRADGSVALFLDGDLQFDSRDEAIYHEALALPALALAEARYRRPLSALICGGGDGLIARELLKSSRVATIDLVDCSQDILELAQEDLRGVNLGSLSDPRVRVHVGDAWSFAEQAAGKKRYDLVVSDLTVPQDEAGARMHGVEWYRLIGSILAPRGILSTNAVSPSASPDGYWCIYNSLRTSLLHPRPFRVAIPSFTEAGYGDDWGFFVGSPRPIRRSEIDGLLLPAPRQGIASVAQLKKLFLFPAEGADRRGSIPPVKGDCSLLLQLIYGSRETVSAAGRTWDGLSFAVDRAPLQPADGNSYLLPPGVRKALATACAEPDNVAGVERLLGSMPALNRYQTDEMVTAFLEQPSRFLSALDIRGLVERLLRRASELPAWFVEELRQLGSSLKVAAGDGQSLLNLGMRVVTIVTLVIILGNLLFPDTVYGKGTTSGGSSAHISSVTSMAHTSSGFVASAPSTVKSSGFRSSSAGRSSAVDELGTLLPSRNYSYYHSYNYDHWSSDIYQPSYSANEQQVDRSSGVYRLTPETDILENGKLAINLTEDAYLLLGKEAGTVVDQKTGKPLLALKKDQALLWRVAREIERQRKGLEKSYANKADWIEWLNWIEFAPWRQDDQAELENLKSARERLVVALASIGYTPESVDSQAAKPPAKAATPPIQGAHQAFSGVWTSMTTQYIVLELADGRTAYMNGKGWFLDDGLKQKLPEPYPEDFRRAIVGYLDTTVKGADAERERLKTALNDLNAEMSALTSDKTDYDSLRSTTPLDESVEYGPQNIPLKEAIRLTDEDITSTREAIDLILQQLEEQPAERLGAQQALKYLGGAS